MHSRYLHKRRLSFHSSQTLAGAGIAALISMVALAASAQAPAPQQPSNAPSTQSANAHATSSKPAVAPEERSIKEDDLRKQLTGKTFYLRDGYLDNDLRFSEDGRLVSTSAKGSHNLCMVQFDKVSLSKHRLELRGIRYGVHFPSDATTQDPLHALDKVRITPKKKYFRISIDRAQVITKKKKKGKKSDGKSSALDSAGLTQVPLDPNQSLSQSAAAAASTPVVPDAEGSILTQARANKLLREALDRIFSQGLDDRFVASLPDFWKPYYKAAEGKGGFRPEAGSVLRQNAVDQKARLITNFEPPSNDYAQNAGVAGMALYHVVVASDGKPGEIAVERPIGFGLDENAVDSIHKASFQPAMKDGKPVAVIVDLVVQFRIFSKRTAEASDQAAASEAQPEAPTLPGPYSVNQPATKQP